jgi:hypothetical protein
MARLGHVALDVTKQKANASKHKAMVEKISQNTGQLPDEMSLDALLKLFRHGATAMARQAQEGIRAAQATDVLAATA